MTDASHNGFDKPPAGWQSLVNEVQARIDAVDSAMANLRVAVRYLTANAAAEHGASAVVAEAPVLAAQAESLWAPATPSPEPVSAAPVETAAATPAYDEAAAREEVRRAVEAARNELAPSAPVSTFSWTMPRNVWPGAAPEPVHHEDPARDEVRRAVEEAKAQLASGELAPAPIQDAIDTLPLPSKPGGEVSAPVQSSEPTHALASVASVDAAALLPAEPVVVPEVAAPVVEVVAQVAEVPPPVAVVSQEAPPAPEVDEAAQRESVRQAVERARAEMQNASAAKDAPEADDEAAAREEVRRAVAQMRNEMSWGSSPHVSFDRPETSQPANAADDPDGKREEVRRVVESARAEMNFGGLSMYDETAPREADGLKPEETQSLFAAFAGADGNSAWQKAEPEFTGMPPSIVIEDAEGRVELARVYDTLNRVDRSQAALLNYTPHSVTVGLAARERLPEPEVMIAAVRDAFGRPCKVTTEGVKMSVKIGEGERAA